uniref:Uncharacterized protein n=1 Tax=Arundo donax TaxID=35708 RepID=A0A0A9ELR9_ARUDO
MLICCCGGGEVLKVDFGVSWQLFVGRCLNNDASNSFVVNEHGSSS